MLKLTHHMTCDVQRVIYIKNRRDVSPSFYLPSSISHSDRIIKLPQLTHLRVCLKLGSKSAASESDKQ